MDYFAWLFFIFIGFEYYMKVNKLMTERPLQQELAQMIWLSCTYVAQYITQQDN